MESIEAVYPRKNRVIFYPVLFPLSAVLAETLLQSDLTLGFKLNDGRHLRLSNSDAFRLAVLVTSLPDLARLSQNLKDGFSQQVRNLFELIFRNMSDNHNQAVRILAKDTLRPRPIRRDGQHSVRF